MPANPLDPWTLRLLWCLAIMVAAASCLPPLLHFLGLSRCRIRLEETDLEPSSNPYPGYADAYHQLQALGFEPQGACRKILRYFLVHWVKSFHGWFFVSEDCQCLAYIYRLVAGEHVRVAFVSYFVDGAYIWTSNASEGYQIKEAKHIHWGCVTNDLSRLLEMHMEVVEQFRSAGHSTENHKDLTSLVPSIERMDYNGIHRSKSAALRLFILAVGWIAVVVFSEMAGDWPTSVVAGGLLWLLFWEVAFRLLVIVWHKVQSVVPHRG